MSLINDSQYDIFFYVVNISNQKSFSCSLSGDSTAPSHIPALSVLPVTFSFKPTERGPLIFDVTFNIVKPFSAIVLGAINNKVLKLIGLCIEPYSRHTSDISDKNGLSLIKAWLSHPKRLIDEYSLLNEDRKLHFDISKTPLVTPDPFKVPGIKFSKDSLILRTLIRSKATDIHARKNMTISVILKHVGLDPVDAGFFASTFFAFDNRPKKYVAGDTDNLDIVYNPTADVSDYSSVYGFGLAISDSDHKYHSIQLIAKYFTDFLIWPVPNVEGNLVLDFGKLEVSTDLSSMFSKQILMCNTFQTTYSWSIKLQNTKSKFSAFEIGSLNGELNSLETYAVPIRVNCNTSGNFESIAELSVRDMADRNSKFVKITTIVMRVYTSQTALGGLPDFIEFGSTVINQKKKQRFTITNTGSSEVKITMLIRSPFSVEPKTIVLEPKSHHPIDLKFNPTESGVIQSKCLFYINQKVVTVPVSGTSGSSDLVCEKYENRDINFGSNLEGDISWLPIYLTNRGTLPVYLKTITSEVPSIVRLKFVEIVSSIPNSTDVNVIKKNYWGIIRRKVLSSCFFSILKSAKNLKQSYQTARPTENISENSGIDINIEYINRINVMENSFSSIIPQLKPYYSYMFLVGYVSKYQPKISTSILFHYLPVTTEDDPRILTSFLKATELSITGKSLRPLEISPLFLDFGLSPAESFASSSQTFQLSSSQGYGVFEQDEVAKKGKNIEVVNMSMETQNLSLKFLTTEFSVSGRSWSVLAGEKLIIPVQFHPQKEQTQYNGEIRFLHTYGKHNVRMVGIGASADVVCEELIDFGSMKAGSEVKRIFKFSNRGLLSSKYALEIHQIGLDFYFDHVEGLSDSTDDSGEILPGQSLYKTLCCRSRTIQKKLSHLNLKWYRVASANAEEFEIPMKVDVGVPEFILQMSEIDFNTTYINISKTVSITLKNPGNATCKWKLMDYSNGALVVTPTEGELDPDDIDYLEIIFTPVEHEPLRVNLFFETDSGKRSLMCYGIVGVPYLQISDDMLRSDFGVVGVNKTQYRPITLKNTGNKEIEYDIKLFNQQYDGQDIEKGAPDVFSLEYAHGFIQPHDELDAIIKCTPRDYNVLFTTELVVLTRDGEEYFGHSQSVGGKAIVKMAPPKSNINSTKPAAHVSSRGVTPSSKTKPVDTMESMKIAYKDHIENLQELIAGLRAAEIDFEKFNRDGSRPVSVEKPTSAPKSGFDAVFDGSDVGGRLKRSKQRELKRAAEGISEIESSIAMSFADSLSSLENDLERGINEGRAKSRQAQMSSFGRYNAGSRNRNEFPLVSADPYNPLKPHLDIITQPLQLMSEDLQNLITQAESIVENTTQQDMIAHINELILSQTKSIVVAVKDQLEEEWVQNRDVLNNALQRLEVSKEVFVNFKEKSNEVQPETVTETNFELGLFKSLQTSDPTLLFNLPNIGNISFDYEIIPNLSHYIVPQLFSSDDRNVSLFRLDRDFGCIEPTSSIDISAVFQGNVAGFYQQGYSFLSDGELVFGFTVSANVGIPILSISTKILDFEMVLKGKTAFKKFILKNIGSYSDSWRIEAERSENTVHPLIKEDAPKNYPVIFSSTKGFLSIGQEVEIEIEFSPIQDTLVQKYSIIWSYEPLFFDVCGILGFSKIVPSFDEQKDKDIAGIDFGICIIGVTYSKTFHLRNSGNAEAIFDLPAPSSSFSLKVASDAQGYVHVMPGASIDVLISYIPREKATTNSSIDIDTGTSNSLIAIKAISGSCEWVSDGELDFSNMKVLTSQERIITIKNDGDLAFPVKISLEPESLLNKMTIQVEPLSRLNFTLDNNRSATITITARATICEQIQGELIVTTNHGFGSKTKNFPFKFQTYDKQVALNSIEDAFVGRILVGEEAIVSRILRNFSSSPVFVRLKTERIDIKPEVAAKKGAKKVASVSSSKIINPWKIKGDSDITLDPESEHGIEIIYESNGNAGSDWHEALLLVEESDVCFSNFRITKIGLN